MLYSTDLAVPAIEVHHHMETTRYSDRLPIPLSPGDVDPTLPYACWDVLMRDDYWMVEY